MATVMIEIVIMIIVTIIIANCNKSNKILACNN